MPKFINKDAVIIGLLFSPSHYNAYAILGLTGLYERYQSLCMAE